MQKINIILAILLFLCLADMPYGYYQLTRFIAMLGFSILAYEANKGGKQAKCLAYLMLVLLFQPFFKVVLGRELWNIVDVIVGLLLLLSIWVDIKQLKKNTSNYVQDHTGHKIKQTLLDKFKKKE